MIEKISEEQEFLEYQLERKLGELNRSEGERRIALAIAELKLEMLTKDIDIIQKRLIKIKSNSS